MLTVIKHFSKHHSCHLRVEFVLVECFWKPYTEQAIRGKWDVTKHIARVEEQDVIQLVTSTWLRKVGDVKFVRVM
jgi:hypothetical protein